jgi:hypothetical protein
VAKKGETTMTESRASEDLEKQVDFWDAIKIITGSAILGNPPLGIIGDNGIGKTESLVAIQKLFKRSKIIRNLDHGGLKVSYSDGTLDATELLFLSDMQNIVNRRYEIQNTTFSMLANIVEPQSFSDLDFQGRDLERRYKSESNFHRMNIIWAGTPRHLDFITKNTRSFDFLSRFAFLSVKRESNNEEMQSEFKLKYIPNADFKIDARPLQQYDGENTRQYQIRKYLTSICIAVGITELSYYVFNPEDRKFIEMKIESLSSKQGWKDWYHLIVRRI